MSDTTRTDFSDVYCCEEKCMLQPRTVVDGLACTICESFCYCRCSCKTWMRKKRELANFCCEQRCFVAPELQVDGQACSKCLAFSFCHCKCISYRKKMAEKLTTVREPTVPLLNSDISTVTHCCEKRCMKLQGSCRIDRIACSRCMFIGYCICECKTFLDAREDK